MRLFAIASAFLSLAAVAQTSSLAGVVVDITGAGVSQAVVRLNSGSKNDQAETDDAGAYKFLNLTAGEYTLQIDRPGFKRRSIKMIVLGDQEQKRMPDVPLDVAGCGFNPRDDLILLPAGTSFGHLTGSVDPPTAGVEVTLVCRTFTLCKSATTDAKGRFTFEMLSPGSYGLNFRGGGFYPENATGYAYDVNAGWESVYGSVRLQRCPYGNCDPKLRPQRPIRICE